MSMFSSYDDKFTDMHTKKVFANEQERFEAWAVDNIGQASRSGYHGRLGRWIYRHNFMNMCWECWQAALQDGECAYEHGPDGFCNKCGWMGNIAAADKEST